MERGGMSTLTRCKTVPETRTTLVDFDEEIHHLYIVRDQSIRGQYV